MLVTTNIPCGNGRVHWIHHDRFEVELIAYSKAARYTTFRIAEIQESRVQQVVLRPDRWSNAGFEKFHTPIWLSRDQGATWEMLSGASVQVAPEAIRFDLRLEPGDDLLLSSEPPRPYAETVEELHRIGEEHPDWTQLRLLGHSIEQRPIFLLRILDPVAVKAVGHGGRVPSFLFLCGEHATEFAGEEITRGMLEAVLEENDTGAALRARGCYDFVLVPNPDGNVHGWHQYNAKDWARHNYAERVDRSWHHEFGEYFSGKRQGLSPETIALGDWVSRERPCFVHNAHSWQGHHGNPGAFRSNPDLLSNSQSAALAEIDAACHHAVNGLGVEFETYPTSNLTGGHLIDHIVEQGFPAYSIEGHPGMGRDNLQLFGRRVMKQLLKTSVLGRATSNPPPPVRAAAVVSF